MAADENLELLLNRVSRIHTNKINRVLEEVNPAQGTAFNVNTSF